MSIIVSCGTCGKKLKVPDDRAGKMAKCPGCLNTFLVTAGGGVGAAAAPPTAVAARMPKTAAAPKTAKGGASIAVSWGFIAMIAGVLLVVGSIIALIFGPLRVQRQWGEIGSDADTNVKSVVDRGMQFNATGGIINTKTPGHYSGGIREGPFFLVPFLVMSMPDAIDFKGTTNEGEFKGKYHPKSGEVECDAELGGLTVAGLDKAIHHGNTKIHITGRMKNNDPDVEVDGKKAIIKVISQD